jgi:hypothetical protein
MRIERKASPIEALYRIPKEYWKEQVSAPSSIHGPAGHKVRRWALGHTFPSKRCSKEGSRSSHGGILQSSLAWQNYIYPSFGEM